MRLSTAWARSRPVGGLVGDDLRPGWWFWPLLRILVSGGGTCVLLPRIFFHSTDIQMNWVSPLLLQHMQIYERCALLNDMGVGIFSHTLDMSGHPSWADPILIALSKRNIIDESLGMVIALGPDR